MKRLDTIAELVPKGMVTADIGTDHAFLPIALAERKISPRIYACDIAEGPLKAAEKNIAAAGLTDQIAVIASDGFANVPMDTECAVTAGMGCATAIGIYERAMDRLPLLKAVITEVNSHVPDFRRWLSTHQYAVMKEKAVYENGHWYVVILWQPREGRNLSEEEILLGPGLLKENSTEFQAYCQYLLEKKTEILAMRKKDPDLGKEIQILREHVR